MTTYRVPVADQLLAQQEHWLPCPGFRLVSVDGPWLGHPQVTICTFEDDDAPADLEGLLVEPVIRIERGQPARVTDRIVVSAAA